jgi:hypothetical protein
MEMLNKFICAKERQGIKAIVIGCRIILGNTFSMKTAGTILCYQNLNNSNSKCELIIVNFTV